MPGRLQRLAGKIKYRHIICVCLFLYTLAPLASVSAGQDALVGVVILQCLLFGVTAYRERKWIGMPDNLLEAALYGVGAFALSGILLYCVGLDVGYQKGYETELNLLLFVLIYLTVKSRPCMEKCYFDSILAALTLMSLICLIAYLIWPGLGGCVGSFVQSRESVAACAMLNILLGGMRYSCCGEKAKQLLYGLSTAMACVVLAVNRDVLSLYMTTVMLLLVVIENVPKREIIKRNLQIFCGFVFLLCNMTLITDYTSLLQVECSGYLLETSVILELWLCLFLCYVMRIWDRLPQKEETEQTAMLQELQRTSKKILAAFLFALLGIVLTGEQLKQLPAGVIGKSLEAEGMVLYQAIWESAESNAFYKSAKAYGVPGVVMMLAVWSGMTERIRKKRKLSIRDNIILKAAAVMTVLLWTMRLQSLTCYLIYLWIAAYAFVPRMVFRKKKSIQEGGRRLPGEEKTEKVFGEDGQEAK